MPIGGIKALSLARVPFNPSGEGVVTSVGLSMPSIFGVSGSPIVSAGTFAVTLNTEAANLIFAGPASGANAIPTFRALSLADLPSGLGTVTSVGLTAPSIFTVSGSPVTTAGSLGFTLVSQVQNTIFAGPTTGGAGVPTFRALTAADIPSGLQPASPANSVQFNFGGSFGGSSTLTWDNTNSILQVTGSEVLILNALANTPTDGLVLENNTAATSTVPQYSPGLRLRGSSWNTTTPASNTADWRLLNETGTTGTSTSPISNFIFQFSSNGGAYANLVKIDSGGTMTANGLNGTSINSSSTITIQNTGNAFLYSPTNLTYGLIAIGNPTAFRIYNADDAAGDTEYAEWGWRQDTNIFTLNLGATGTGAVRNAAIIPNITIGSGTVPNSTLDVISNGIIAAPTNAQGITVENTTLSTSGIPGQYSPGARFHGSSWNSVDSTARSTDWQMYNQSSNSLTSGMAASEFILGYSDNGGSYNPAVTFELGGSASDIRVFFPSNLTAAGNTNSNSYSIIGGGIGFGSSGTSGTMELSTSSSAPSALRIANFVTSGNNSEYVELGWKQDTNIFTIGLGQTGTGVIRNMAVISPLAFATASAPTSDIDVIRNGIGATIVSSDGVALSNNTASTSSLNQNSPGVRFRAHNWNTTSVADEYSDWYIYSAASNSSSAGNANALLSFAFASNGASYGTLMNLSPNGVNIFSTLNMSGQIFTPAISITSVGEIQLGTAANKLALDDGVTPVSFQIFNTFAGGAGEYLELGFKNTANIATIATGAAGVGNVVRPLAIPQSLYVGAAIAPTASVHISGSSAGAAGTGPLKLTPGTLLVTPEDGLFEYDGTHLYFTIGSTRNTIL